MAEATPAITMIAKAVFAGLTLFCTVLSWQGLRATLSYQPYHRLAADIGSGRLEQSDADRITPFLHQGDDRILQGDPRIFRSKAILQSYIIDLTASVKGLDPLAPSQDADIITARRAALHQIRVALAQNPSDGDLWLRAAMLAQSLSHPAQEVASLVAWSKDTTPHEGWVLRRREILLSGFD